MGLSALLWPAAAWAQGADAIDPAEIRQLIEQNRRLQAEVASQQRTIEDLRSRVNAIEQASTNNQRELQNLEDQAAPVPASEPPPVADSPGQAVRISAETGFAFFASGSDGLYANGEFKIDDAKVFLEAPISKDLYFHAELDLQTRESEDNNFHLGEIYAEYELPDGSFNLRVGRMYIPFGEEYQVRGVMDNPLVSHSLSDLWGMDEGVEIFGSLGKFSYFGAVQDGGINTLRNYHSDKSVALRAGYDPTSRAHFSASAMRTGHLNPTLDELSALWFGNGFFRALGPNATTTEFWANLAELDGSVHWRDGHLKAAGGLVQFDDNNPAANDTRHLSYYYIEGVQHLSDPLYGAVRFSQINAPGGYPIAGQGSMSEYFFTNIMTSSISRVTVGLGYSFSAPTLLKIEYSPEWGNTTTGEHRDEENLFSTELAVKF